MTSPGANVPRSVPKWLLALLLAGVALLSYWPTLSNGFIWDDDYYVQTNPYLRSASGLETLWTHLGAVPQYYPLTHTTFWIEYHLWGLRPLGYHVDNLLLHIFSSLLLWRLLVLLEIPGAFLGAMLFCMHPIQVESVVWVTERKNVLSGLLYFASLRIYLNTAWGRRLLPNRPSAPPFRIWAHRAWYLLSLTLFILALLSKTVTATLPAVILLLIWYRRGSFRLADVAPLLPMFCAAIFLGSITGWMEKHIVGAIGPDFQFSLAQRISIAGRAVWFYLWKLICPLRLSFIYPRWNIDVSSRPWILLFPLLVLTSLAALAMLVRRLGRGPLTASLFFVGTLAPALGFLNVFPMRFSFVADHFQYLACVGPLVLFAAIVTRFLPRTTSIFVAAAVVAALCLITRSRTHVYRDRLSLWSDTLIKNPGSGMAHANYASLLLEAGDVAGAERQFRIAHALRPSDPSDCINIGYCVSAQGDLQQAIQWYKLAAAVTPDVSEPIFQKVKALPWYQLGWTYAKLADNAARTQQMLLRRRDLADAIASYRRAIELYPGDSAAMVNLGVLLQEVGDLPGAIAQERTALALDPDAIAAYTDLGNALLAENDPQGAAEQYTQVVRRQPGNALALNNLGSIEARRRRWDRAIELFRAALVADPHLKVAQDNLAKALAPARAGR